MHNESKIISAVKCYQTVFKLKKVNLKAKNRGCYIILLNEVIGKLLIKILHVNCTPTTSIVKAIAMVYSNICLLITHGEGRSFYLSVDSKTFKQLRNKIKKGASRLF